MILFDFYHPNMILFDLEWNQTAQQTVLHRCESVKACEHSVLNWLQRHWCKCWSVLTGVREHASVPHGVVGSHCFVICMADYGHGSTNTYLRVLAKRVLCFIPVLLVPWYNLGIKAFLFYQTSTNAHSITNSSDSHKKPIVFPPYST